MSGADADRPKGAPGGRPTPARDGTSPEEPRIDREGGAVGLRLAIGKDGLGIELARTVQVGPVDVVELVVRLPRVRFPFDVTGGVSRFRHKRGELVRAALEIDERRVAAWAEPKLRGLVAVGPQRVSVKIRPTGATITVSARTDAANANAGARVPVLVFDVAVVPVRDDLVVVVHGARGANLGETPTSLAIRAVSALASTARREGSAFVVSHPAGVLARRLLPDAGVRAPATGGVVLSAIGASAGVAILAFAKDALSPSPAQEAARALEAAHLAREGDGARLKGDLARARTHDLDALDRAPRHPELARRIAEVDHAAGGRAEAAIATLRASASATGGLPRVGALLAELLVEHGDVTSAVATLLAEAEREPSDALAAVLLGRAAELAQDPFDALAWLDAAVARAPRIPELRWERARRRLASGRLDDMRADVQELEALATGPRERHDVLRRAADLYRHAGLGTEAARLYERALLYRPDDPQALAGLGAALAEEGRAARGAALLSHAIEAASAQRLPTAWMELALGHVLGDRLSDRPAAIARLRAIPDDVPEAAFARGLEGRYRAALGDASGAALAFARIRERAAEASAIPWLREAARFEAARGDKQAAHRHALAALALAPQDPEVVALVRELSPAPLAAAPALPPAPAPVAALAPAPEPAAQPEEADPATLEARVESLTRTLQGDPTNDAVVDELVALLTRLGRGMELLALLSARLEDAPAERRAELLLRHREVLAKLEADARAEGREVEADLFKMAREAS